MTQLAGSIRRELLHRDEILKGSRRRFSARVTSVLENRSFLYRSTRRTGEDEDHPPLRFPTWALPDTPRRGRKTNADLVRTSREILGLKIAKPLASFSAVLARSSKSCRDTRGGAASDSLGWPGQHGR